MSRARIKTESYRAEDLEMDDIVKLRITNRIQWVLLTKDAEKISGDDMAVLLTYRPLIGNSASIRIGRYELIPLQVEVSA